jgi:hypothetical protein
VAQQAPQAREELLVGEHAPNVGVGEPARAKMLGGALAIAEQRDRAPVRQRAPEVRVADEDPVAPALQLELADHQLVQKPDHVGAGADQVSGVLEWLLERAGAAKTIAALQHEDAVAGARQVRRCRQAVVAAAHHDRVPFARRQSSHRLRQPDPAERSVDVDHARQAR